MSQKITADRKLNFGCSVLLRAFRRGFGGFDKSPDKLLSSGMEDHFINTIHVKDRQAKKRAKACRSTSLSTSWWRALTKGPAAAGLPSSLQPITLARPASASRGTCGSWQYFASRLLRTVVPAGGTVLFISSQSTSTGRASAAK